MAAKRIAASSINWAAFAERVPPNQRVNFLTLKGKTDNYLRRVNANPPEPPKLDFSAYKGKVPIAGLVESFQKQYDALKVPYPSENLTPKINEQEKAAAAGTAAFIAASKQRIQEYEQKIAKWDDVLPYEEMTMEDFYDAHPDVAIDTVNRPTFWPHTPEEQLDYVEKEIGQEEVEVAKK